MLNPKRANGNHWLGAHRARVSVVVVTTVAAALLVVGPVPSNATSDPGLERDLLALTNVDRTSNGVPAVGADARLISAARERSDDMQARNYFSHDIPPDGRKVFDLLDARNVDFEMQGRTSPSTLPDAPPPYRRQSRAS